MKLKFTLSTEEMLDILDCYQHQPAMKRKVYLIAIAMGFIFSISYLLNPGNITTMEGYIKKLQGSMLYTGGVFTIGLMFGLLLNVWNKYRQKKKLQKIPPIDYTIFLGKKEVQISTPHQDINLNPKNINKVEIMKDYLMLYYTFEKTRGIATIPRQVINNHSEKDKLEAIIHSWNKKFSEFELIWSE